jgi:NAD(P)-dependent dehydrogenase (short-subunit alcohol dehydrogenase family)
MTAPTEYLGRMFSLAGRVAVVTALARGGARVVLVARGRAGLLATADALTSAGASAGIVAADLGETERVQLVADEAAAVFGPPDILVNAAAVNLRPPLGELSAAQWHETMRLNLEAPFLLGQAYGPSMAARGWGRIINVTSQQAERAYGNSGAYGVSKAGLAGLTRSQAEAWSASGVCCNAIAPGVVDTPMTSAIFADPGTATAMAHRTLVGRNGVPADFEGIAVFLASGASAAVTGQMIFVDCGFSAH